MVARTRLLEHGAAEVVVLEVLADPGGSGPNRTGAPPDESAQSF